MRALYIPLFAVFILLTGCDNKKPTTDAEEERNPLVSSGQEYLEQGSYDEAEAAFKKALEDNPLMARPHLDLAIIYQEYKINYIHAIYHYDRYLELRPDAEKAQFIREQRDKVEEALVITNIRESEQFSKLINERNQLVQMINQQKQQLAATEQKLLATEARLASGNKSVTETVPKTSTPVVEQPKVAPPKSAESSQKHQIYHVVAGDTLSKIATKFYGNSGKWDIIYDANRDTMKNPGHLKEGQTLVIPTIGN